jgi:Domain of unknown function (DUF4188)
MPQILSKLRGAVEFIDHPIISSNLRTTSWIIVGALLFSAATSLLGRNIATLLALIALSTRLVPALLVATGRRPNEQLQEVMAGKTTALFPNADGTTEGAKPSNQSMALLILGIKISHPLGYFAPGAKQAGDYFQSLVKDLNEHPTEHGWLGGSIVQGHPSRPGELGHLSIIGYFKSMDDLHRFAHGAHHREAWNWWNKNVKSMPHLGVYHEAYDIPARHWEAVYLQTPKTGLGQAKVQVASGEMKSVIADARKGVWKSSAGRMGREESKTYDDDPYKNE